MGIGVITTRAHGFTTHRSAKQKLKAMAHVQITEYSTVIKTTPETRKKKCEREVARGRGRRRAAPANRSWTVGKGKGLHTLAQQNAHPKRVPTTVSRGANQALPPTPAGVQRFRGSLCAELHASHAHLSARPKVESWGRPAACTLTSLGAPEGWGGAACQWSLSRSRTRLLSSWEGEREGVREGSTAGGPQGV